MNRDAKSKSNTSKVSTKKGIPYYASPLVAIQNKIITLTAQIENMPCSLTYYCRGCAYYHVGKYPEAIADLSMAIKLDPDYAEAYEYRAYAYYWLAKYALAWSDIHAAQDLGSGVSRQFLEYLKDVSL